MKRVRYSVAISLVGHFAGPNGESDSSVMDPEINFQALFGSFDTILMGRKTYEADRQQSKGARMPGMRTYVFSRTLSQSKCARVIVSDRPTEMLAELKSKPGGKVSR